jgi:hypothetical protein
MRTSLTAMVQQIHLPVPISSSIKIPALNRSLSGYAYYLFFGAQFISISNTDHLLPFETPDYVLLASDDDSF